MINVLIVCQGGMSSSFLVNKIKEAFIKRGEGIQIIAKASMEIVDYIENVDIVLVAPNVLYEMEDIREICEEHNIVPVILPMELYGRMDGDAIRLFIMNLQNGGKDGSGEEVL
jgi:PTS system cellobiose-specific IIB component